MKLLFFTIMLLPLIGCSEEDIGITGDIPSQICGYWKETVKSQPNSDYLIRELRFDADNFFAVTWFPFEVYKDYAGDYVYDSTNGEITLSIVYANYIPEGLDLNGVVRTNNQGELVLYNIYLGHPPGASDFSQESRMYTFEKFFDSCSG